MNLTFHIWRQRAAQDPGRLVKYELTGAEPDLSVLEAIDILNEQLMGRGEAPVAFDSDCREGICGACGFLINGIAHGPQRGSTVCQLHLRYFQDGATLQLEPWRDRAFPVIQDLVVDRGSLDRIVQAGGFISARTGAAPEANAVPVAKVDAELAMDAAACIGCGACVAACPNGSSALFTAAKISHLSLLPQGQPERARRVIHMVAAMDREGFGNCSMHRECEAVCPKEISVRFITRMNREYLRASFKEREIVVPELAGRAPA